MLFRWLSNDQIGGINYENCSAYLRQYSLYYLIITLSGLLGIYEELLLVPRTGSLKFQRENRSINKSYVDDELVSTSECIAMSAVLTSFVIIGYCTAGRKYLSRSGLKGRWMIAKPDNISKEIHLLHLSIICQLLAVTVTSAITCALKLLIGNTRPDFLARCQLKRSREDIAGKIFTVEDCQQKDPSILYEGLKSTPSGHSSLVACGLGFLYLWQCRFVKGSNKKHLWCLGLALLVMMSRVADHKHHWYDLVFGGTLGYIVLLLSWKNIFENDGGSSLPLPVTHRTA